LARDGQAQAGAAVRRVVELSACSKALNSRRRDADAGVLHLEAQQHAGGLAVCSCTATRSVTLPCSVNLTALLA
jgi:hypothetical protein